MIRIIFFLVSLPLATLAEVSPRVVKLGVATDLSGVGAYWGTQTQRGIALAQRDIKSEGGNLEIVWADHGFKPMTALTDVQRFIDVDHVDAVWVEFAPTVVASSSAVAKAKALFVANSAATSILRTNPYAFKAYLDYESGCAAVAAHWKQKGLTKIGMLRLNAEFADLCLKGAQSQFSNISVVSYDFGESVKSQVLRLKNEKIEAILNPSLEADMLNTLKALREINYHVPVGVTEPEGITDQVRAQYSDMLQGVTSFGFPPISESFQTKFKSEYPGVPATAMEGAAMAYTHARQVFLAISRCDRGNINCTVKEMNNSPSDNTLGFIRWHGRIAAYDFTLKEWKNGKLVTLKTRL